MNLVRNHIISYRRQILEITGEDNLPEIFKREIPPEVAQKNFLESLKNRGKIKNKKAKE